MARTFTDDPFILDLVQQRKAAVAAWRTAMEDEQRLYAERSPLHQEAMQKMEAALESLQRIEAILCESFTSALEHSTKGTP